MLSHFSRSRPSGGPIEASPPSSHHEETCCDCVAHRAADSAAGQGPPGLLIAPLLACAFCPACLSIWTPLLAALGLRIAVTEAVHHAVLAMAIALSGGLTVWRSYRKRRWHPAFIVAAGVGALLLGHFQGGGELVELLGSAGLVLGAVAERRAKSSVLLSQRATL